MVFNIIEDVQICTLMPAIIFGIILSIIWDISFVKKIRHLVLLHRECMVKSNTDPFGNYLEAAQHFKVEIHKYKFLLLMNITEFGAIQIYTLGAALTFTLHPDDVLNPSRFVILNCSTELAHFNNIMMEAMTGI